MIYLSINGFMGISYMYWAILAFLISIASFFIKIPPFALPNNISNWIFKKIILFYFPGTAWFIISWIFFRLHRRDGDMTFWIYCLLILAIILFVTFIVVWRIDRIKIKRLRYKNATSQK